MLESWTAGPDEWIEMLFELMHRATPVALIDLGESNGTLHSLRAVLDPDHMPIGTIDEGITCADRLSKWWSGRSIPATRSGLREVLERLDIVRTEALLMRSYGLSLSDQYWIRPAGSGLDWADVNFFDNGFSDDMGDLLFGKEVWQGSLDLTSPDNASDGLLMKRWKIIGGKRYLMKSGTMPFMQEPFNEVMASIIADSLGMPHIDYGIVEHEGAVCSICEDFITRDTELVSAHAVMRSEVHEPGISLYDHYVTCCGRHSLDVVPMLDRMMVLDYLIANGDRHTNNFGVIRDVGTLEWMGPAPIYDSGSSLGYNQDTADLGGVTFVGCKPFSDIWSVQMGYVRDTDWIDFTALDDAIDRCGELLSSVGRYRDRGRDAAIEGMLRSRASDLREWIRTR